MESAGYTEVLALFTGYRRSRRMALQQAAAIAGPRGMVHVVRNADYISPIVGMAGLAGLTTDLDWVEEAEFAEAAAILAPTGCGWFWHSVQGREWSHVLDRARRAGLPAVVPAWSRPWGEPRLVLPDRRHEPRSADALGPKNDDGPRDS
ncbi:hypothetical protein ACQPXH_21075 [Nocardia sp. CA-135953]|uniref:hypothetical protein n=1 Tax=Nocardia sp. CA-135953 TaxID=3239978 RepID=UPI003D995300